MDGAMGCDRRGWNPATFPYNPSSTRLLNPKAFCFESRLGLEKKKINQKG